jgi:hypothetical protein
MEPHTHPLYEETFKHIATVLDVIAESQAEQADALAETRKEQVEQARHLTEMLKIQIEQAKTSQETSRRYDQALEGLAQAMATLTLKSAETEDKLNALIALMDQHLNEHRRTN